MVIAEDKNLQNGLIIVDDIARDPIIDFNLYSRAIYKIIIKSYLKFTIGIFGDCGTRKTTLMGLINKILQTSNFLKGELNYERIKRQLQVIHLEQVLIIKSTMGNYDDTLSL